MPVMSRQAAELAAQLARSERIERELEARPDTLVPGGLVPVPVQEPKALQVPKVGHAQGTPDGEQAAPNQPDWDGAPLLELVWRCSLPLRLCT